MDFAEHPEIVGLYTNTHFPEVQIHKTSAAHRSLRYVVTHHGMIVSFADDLMAAVAAAKRYTVLGEAPLETP